MRREHRIWHPHHPGRMGDLDRLARQAAALGGRRALAAWLAERSSGSGLQPELRVAYVHGERHDLWWEFTLEASFRWQAHLHRIRPALYQQRLRRLTRALGLEGLLGREVSSLTHSSRALADLAVALLPQPDLLLWEEPFYLLGQADAGRAIRLVQELHQAGMGLVAVAAEPPGLLDLETAHPAAQGRQALAH
ncbi:MAG: hypothetical protein ACOY93_08255 [Bacillota bacterium]